MTNVQSKFLVPVACTCKDFHHPWTNNCVNASAGLLLASTPYCLRVYTMVYMLSLIMRHRIPTGRDIKRTLQGILQSSAFLVTNSYTFLLYNCLIRNLIGHYYCPTVAFIPSFLASWTAIVLERPARRPLLALYVANVATETLWNMAEARGLVRSVPYGQTLIFGASISIFLYLYRLGLHKTQCKDSVFNILRFFVGKTEEGPITKRIEEPPSIENTQQSRPPLDFRNISVLVQIYGRFLDTMKSKHNSCPHRLPCVNYALLGGLKPFLSGLGIQVALKLLMNVKRIVQGRMNWRKTLFDKSTLNLGLFLGLFSFLYKASSCTLRHSFGYDDPRFAIPAGFIGSIAFTQYPDVTVALYIMWKMFQIVYNLGIEKGIVPKVSGFTIFLYSFCTGMLFHAGILEPKTLRPSYFKFLQAISGERLSKFQLETFDVFGQQASQSAREVCQRLNVVNKSPLPIFSLASF